MDDLQAQMQAILNDPNMMQTIMGLAQNMSAPQPEQAAKQEPQGFEGLDISMLQKLAGYAKQSSIDSNQKNLLSALAPFLSRERIGKLERAMRAAKLARLASGIFGGQLFG